MSGGIWEVTGGKTSGGVVVRQGKDTKSPEHPDGRLATGSVVVELELDGERMRYTLLQGEGPREGWVALKFKDTRLLKPAGEKGTKAAKEEAEVKKARENYGTEGAKRVWLMPQGTRGDVQPIVALGVGLRKAGMEVRILASGNFKSFVESYGLQFTEQGVDMRQMMDEDKKKYSKLSADSEVAQNYKEDRMSIGSELLDRAFKSKETLTASTKVVLGLLETEKPDLIVAHGLNHCVPHFAWRRHGVPTCGLEFFPSMHCNREEMASHLEDLQETSQMVVEDMGGDSALEGVEVDEFVDWRKTRNFCAVGPQIIDVLGELGYTEEQKAEYKKMCTGFLVLDLSLQMTDTSQFGGSAGLKRMQDYLDAGSPPIYLGWGSMPIPTSFMAKFVFAFRMNKLRAIICAGWGGHSLEGLKQFVQEVMPEDPMGLVDYATNELLFVTVAPHEWLFQRCSCTIHHGGAGTTCAALRGGVPTIITPFAVDQFAYAEWVTKMGCGVSLDIMENAERFMDPKWSKALRQCTSDKDMIAKAKAIGEDLRSQDCVADTAKRIDELVKESRERPAGEKRRFGH